MSDHDRASQGRLARLCGTGNPLRLAARAAGRFWARLRPGCSVMAADDLDERLKRDIGYAGRVGLQDHRTAHYRRLLQHGKPLA